MKPTALALSVLLLSAPCALFSQSSLSYYRATPNVAAEESTAGAGGVASTAAMKAQPASVKPLSRIALSGGISLMGINLQAATNLSRHFNLRGVGNVFNYNVENISTNGFNVSGKLNFATAGASVDYYPFANHGFRLSPGVLFYNQNNISASGVVASGNSITLDGTDYYSADPTKVPGATPITVNAQLGLNTNKQAFTMTTGWGNLISRKGGHWSFPLEIGGAFVGKPAIGLTLTGWGCNSQNQSTQTCADLTSASADVAQQVNTSLNQQIAKWKNDLDPLKVYPIFSFGVAYNFRIR